MSEPEVRAPSGSILKPDLIAIGDNRTSAFVMDVAVSGDGENPNVKEKSKATKYNVQGSDGVLVKGC